MVATGRPAAAPAAAWPDAQRYAGDSGLPLEPEPCLLHFAGRDRFARPLWMHCAAAQGWRRMRLHAAQDGIALDAISGFRSHAYQLGIFERKLARGLSVAEILKVNAAPGFSEHHSGYALDIGTPAMRRPKNRSKPPTRSPGCRCMPAGMASI